MLRTDNARLDAVVLTHEHMDHVAGLDDLRPLIFAQNQPMQLWATDRVEKRLREQFAYAFSAKRYPGAPEFELKRIVPGTEFTIGDQEWIPILGQHGTWPVLGFRIGNMVYLTDVSGMEPEEQGKIRGAEVLVVNALRKTPHISHFSLDEAVEFALETKVPNVYFTHISHHMATPRGQYRTPQGDGVSLRRVEANGLESRHFFVKNSAHCTALAGPGGHIDPKRIGACRLSIYIKDCKVCRASNVHMYRT